MKLSRRDWVRLLLLWLGGIDLRLTMLAVPPLIPLIHRDLHLDEKGVGALVSLPVLLLATAAVPGSLLIARLGIRGALMTGLGLVAVFGATRGLGPSTPVLFTSTFLMGLGVAVSQPAFPSIVRDWFPRRIAIATAVYSNGILIGETLPTALTTPVGALPAAHGDWRWALALWSVFVAFSAVAIAIAAPKRGPKPSVPTRWWPSWREGQTMRIGIVDRLLTGRAGFIGSAALMVAAQVGIVVTPGPAILIWALVLGFAAALAFIVVLTMPPRIAAPGEVHRMSAGVFTFQYAVAFFVPLIAGAVWDATGRAVLAFVPGIIAAVVMGWLALSLRIPPAEPRARAT